MRRFLSLLAAFLLAILPACADTPFGGFFPDPANTGDKDATYITLSNSAILTNERVLSPSARFSITDNGPNGTYVLELATVAAGYGGTGATTYQGGFNNLAGGTTGAALATGDTLYYNGTNWARLAIGTAGQFLSVVAGVPAWSTSPAGAPASAQYVTLAVDGGLSAERTLAGTANKITITDGGANNPVTLNIGSDVVTLTDTQTLTNKTLTSPKLTYSATDGLLLRNSVASFDGKLIWADWPANRTLTIPDPGADASFVMTEGAQTVNGTKTLSGLKLSANQFSTSTGNTVTVPDAADTLANLAGTQTLSGKTYQAPIFASGTTLTLKQTTADYTLDWANPGAARAYHITDIGGAGDFVMKSTASAYTAGALFYGDGNKLVIGPAGTSGQPLLSGGTGAYTFGTLSQSYGGTGITSYTAGDILVANDSATLAKLAGSGTDGWVLTYDSTGNPNVKWAAGGSGAPTDAEYVVSAANGTLTAEDVLTAGTGITVTNGAGTATVGLDVSVPSDQTITSAGSLTVAHSLGAAPRFVISRLVCQTGELGYTAGDVVEISPYIPMDTSTHVGMSVVCDATNINVRFGSSGSAFYLLNKTTGNYAAATNGNWKVRFICIK